MKRSPAIAKEAFAGILKETGLPLSWRAKVKLRRALLGLSYVYEETKERQKYPSPSKQSDDLKRISDAARKLLETCGYDEIAEEIASRYLKSAIGGALNEFARQHGAFEDMPQPRTYDLQFIKGPNIDYHEQQKLKLILAGVRILEKAANAAKIEKEKEVGSKPTHRGDLALDSTLLQLGVIYIGVYARPPAVNRTGPFARFLSAVLLSLGEHPNKATPSALAGRWSRINRKMKSNL